MTNKLAFIRFGAVGFIEWLGCWTSGFLTPIYGLFSTCVQGIGKTRKTKGQYRSSAHQEYNTLSGMHEKEHPHFNKH